MAKGNFDRCMDIVAKWEGGYVNHPRDPGGATNYGITIGTLRSWRGKPVTAQDVQNLTKEEARKIYWAWYAQPVRFDDLPEGVDLVAFDFAVNSGPSRSAKFLQRALHVKADGFIGLVTLEAAEKAKPQTLINDVLNARLSWLQGLGTWATFGRGWRNRIEDVRQNALEMARGKPAEVLTRQKPAEVSTPKFDLAAWIAALFSSLFKRG